MTLALSSPLFAGFSTAPQDKFGDRREPVGLSERRAERELMTLKQWAITNGYNYEWAKKAKQRGQLVPNGDSFALAGGDSGDKVVPSIEKPAVGECSGCAELRRRLEELELAIADLVQNHRPVNVQSQRTRYVADEFSQAFPEYG